MARGGGIKGKEGGGRKLRPKESAAQKLARSPSATPEQRQEAVRASQHGKLIQKGVRSKSQSAARRMLRDPSSTKEQKVAAREALEGSSEIRTRRKKRK